MNLNVDLDIMLVVPAQALTAVLRDHLPDYAAVTPTCPTASSWKPPATIASISDTVTAPW